MLWCFLLSLPLLLLLLLNSSTIVKKKNSESKLGGSVLEAVRFNFLLHLALCKYGYFSIVIFPRKYINLQAVTLSSDGNTMEKVRFLLGVAKRLSDKDHIVDCSLAVMSNCFTWFLYVSIDVRKLFQIGRQSLIPQNVRIKICISILKTETRIQ